MKGDFFCKLCYISSTFNILESGALTGCLIHSEMSTFTLLTTSLNTLSLL